MTEPDRGARLPDTLRTTPYVNGRFLSRTSGGTLRKLDPTTGELLAEVAVAGSGDVAEAVSCAAQVQPAWERAGAAARAEGLRRLAAAIRADDQVLGVIGTRESGVPTRLSRAMAHRSAEFLDYFASLADEGALRPARQVSAAGNATVAAAAYGVVGVLPSWNGHSGMWRKCAAALAAGNTVVVKASELAPLAPLRYAELAGRAGVPPGIFNVVTGGPEVGQLLVGDPRVAKVSFTGGAAGASSVLANLARRNAPAVLELGGKSAAIVFADVDMRQVARAVATACMALSGQGCINPTRLLVERSAVAEATGVALATVAQMRVGDPADPATDLGPLITAAARDRVAAAVGGCRDGSGARVLDVPRIRRLPDTGYFAEPVVVEVADPQAPVAQEELFGPVLCVQSFDREQQAVELANATRYGLAAYVFTADAQRAHRVARSMAAGCVSINRVGPIPPHLPFGGVKASGFGREGGREGLSEFLQTQVVVEERGPLAIEPATWISGAARTAAR